jgi:formate-dependent phosphoribosylglycinamide formyltransferase (GAR transformylase)
MGVALARAKNTDEATKKALAVAAAIKVKI